MAFSVFPAIDCTPPFLIDVFTDALDDDGAGDGNDPADSVRSQGIT